MKHIRANSTEVIHSFPIAIVVSLYNRAITEELKQGTVQRLIEQGFEPKDILLVEVPGAIEIPLIVKKIAKQDQVKVIITLGAVIRGETSHYDYVCQQVSDGCQRTALDYDIPVIFGILTTENEEQAWDRLGGKEGHKGTDAADCAIAMYSVMSQLSR